MPPAADPDPDLIFLFQQAGHALQAQVAAALAGLGITPRDHTVLSGALGAERTQGELAELAALDKTTMVATIDRLERNGLAERRPSTTDRRARIIHVTPAGKRAVTAGSAVVARAYEEVLGTLPERQRSALLQGLSRLVRGPLATPLLHERPDRRRT